MALFDRVLLQPSVFFSIPDLLLIRCLADISAVIFVVQDEDLHYMASYIGADSGANLIPICLDGLPRGHFSRVVKMEAVAALDIKPLMKDFLYWRFKESDERFSYSSETYKA